VGTDKRERQKAGKLARAEAETAAMRRARTRRTALRVVMGAAVVLALLFGYSTLTGDDDGSDTETADDSETTAPDDTTATTAAYTNPDLAQEVLDRGAPDLAPPPSDTAADALEIETVIEGEGAEAAAGDTLTVHYIGATADGNVFDQSWERGEPFPVTIGQGQVIAGWDEGLVGAKIGERRRLVIGADKAYGATGQPPDIPPDAPLAFEVDIVDIAPAAQ
jgi:peptidylprolyl isomerase